MLANGSTVEEPAIWMVSRAWAAVDRPTAREAAIAMLSVLFLKLIFTILSAF